MSLTLKDTRICIKKLNFDIAGKITLKLEDGRLIIVPLKYFPDIQKLPVEKRKKYTIVDGEHYFILEYLDKHTTKIIQGEKFSGLLVPLVGKMLDNTEKGFQLMNESIKHECERK